MNLSERLANIASMLNTGRYVHSLTDEKRAVAVGWDPDFGQEHPQGWREDTTIPNDRPREFYIVIREARVNRLMKREIYERLKR